MLKKLASTILTLSLAATTFGFGQSAQSAYPSPSTGGTRTLTGVTATPADGFTIHVSAPHVVNGKVMGPYQHYCKVMEPNPPQIICLIFDSTDPNARLTQVEYIIAKSLTRAKVPLQEWNKNWHDHKLEIETGRVKVHDLPEDKAKEVAELIATTDGIIFYIETHDGIPTGKVSIPQAVGHKPMSQAAYDRSKPAPVEKGARK